MSGIEVVGIVLNCIPLLISGLEHYRDGVDTMKDMWQYKEKIEDLITSFTASTAKYRLTCEHLLIPLMLPDNEYNELLNKPSGDIWKGKELSEHIHQRLGDSYGAYSRLVTRLQTALLKFARKLGLNPNNEMKPLWVHEDQVIGSKNLEKFFKMSNRLWKSVKLGFDSKQIDKLLDQIEKDISRIDNLTQNNVQLEPLRREMQRKSNTVYWQRIRNHAKRLFEAISSRWLCDCEHEHEARLKLQVRNFCDSKDMSQLRFSLLFFFDGVAVSAASPPWDWRGVDIEPIEAGTKPSVPEIAVHGQSKSVSSATVLPSLALSQSQNKMGASTSKISSLCNALKQEPGEVCCIGFLDDQPWQHYVYASHLWNCEREHLKAFSLHEYLGGNVAGLVANPGGLSVKERYSLSLVLASTVLQLSKTPWLNDSWGLSDIHMLNPKDTTFVATEAYVSKKFAIKSSLNNNPKSQSRWFVQNETVFALGVLLIELYFGQRLHMFKTLADVDGQGNDTVFTEYTIARRLVKELADREVPKYSEAAQRCICFNFDATNPDLETQHFQEQFQRGVVTPLQELYDFVVLNKKC